MVTTMTDGEAIEAVRGLAKRRGCTLGRLSVAVLVTSDYPPNVDGRFRERYLGHWLVWFDHPEHWLDGGQFFSVNDASGTPEWVNAPPSVLDLVRNLFSN